MYDYIVFFLQMAKKKINGTYFSLHKKQTKSLKVRVDWKKAPIDQFQMLPIYFI